MKLQRNVYTIILLTLLCIMGLYGILTTPPSLEDDIIGPMTLPWFSLAGGVFCIVLLFIKGLLSPTLVPNEDRKPVLKTFVYVGILALYLASMIIIGDYFSTTNTIIIPYGGGFSIASSLFLAVSLSLLGRKNYKEVAIITLSTVSILVLIFGKFFNIMLP